jgi:opacity protein-like surface antigen
MRKILIGVACATLWIGAAYAEDVMASRYGNTTVATDADGTQTKLYYKADGTFTGKRGMIPLKGTWKVESDKLCITSDMTMPGTPNPLCAPVAAHKLGDTWSAGGRTVMLVQGIQ